MKVSFIYIEYDSRLNLKKEEQVADAPLFDDIYQVADKKTNKRKSRRPQTPEARKEMAEIREASQ